MKQLLLYVLLIFTIAAKGQELYKNSGLQGPPGVTSVTNGLRNYAQGIGVGGVFNKTITTEYFDPTTQFYLLGDTIGWLSGGGHFFGIGNVGNGGSAFFQNFAQVGITSTSQNNFIVAGGDGFMSRAIFLNASDPAGNLFDMSITDSVHFTNPQVTGFAGNHDGIFFCNLYSGEWVNGFEVDAGVNLNIYKMEGRSSIWQWDLLWSSDTINHNGDVGAISAMGSDSLRLSLHENNEVGIGIIHNDVQVFQVFSKNLGIAFGIDTFGGVQYRGVDSVTLFTGLPFTPAAGREYYCSDCGGNGSTGVKYMRISGAWKREW